MTLQFEKDDRVIALIDMDCFYVQIEERDDPSIKGVPSAVVQYNAWKGGSIIAVNYEARARGVGRHIRGDEAKEICPEIILVKVPESRGKADLTKYRAAGQQVIQIVTEFSSCVERASIDEAYIDLTQIVNDRIKNLTTKEIINNLNKDNLENNFILGVPTVSSWLETLTYGDIVPIEDVKLTVGAEIIGEIRKVVFERSGFRCSAGIAHNKVLAKLACGINKPNKQTVVPQFSIPDLFKLTKINKVRNLGGKLGYDLFEKLGCETMSDLLKFSIKELTAVVGEKAGSWIFRLAKGFDDEKVVARQLAKSIGCNKMFNGPEALLSKEKVKYWLDQLSAEVVERLEKDLVTNNRRAKSLTLSVRLKEKSISRAVETNLSCSAERMAADAFGIMEKLYQIHGLQPVTNLGLSASKFEDELDVNCTKIDEYFSKEAASTSSRIPSCFIIKSAAAKPGRSSDINMLNSEHDLPTETGDINRQIEGNNQSVKLDSNSTDSQSSQSFFNRQESPKKQPPEINSSTSTSALNPAPEPELDPNDFMKQCEKCNQSIVVWDYDSHLDYHVAKELHKEINRLPVSTIEKVTRPKRTCLSRGGGAKRGRNTNATINPSDGMKTLDNYFPHLE